MALAWTLTDSQAKNIYNKMCNYYNSPENLPNKINDSRTFFGIANFTRDKLYYCIQYLKEQFGRGWFTSDFSERSKILKQIADELYNIFGGAVNVDGVYKFLSWVYTFAKNDASALNYFQGGYYSIVDSIVDSFKDNVVTPVNEVAETISYGVKYPVLTLENPVFKWGAVAAGVLILYKLLK